MSELQEHADFLIKTLGLTYLHRESGFIGILGRSCQYVTVEKPPTDGKHNTAEASIVPNLSKLPKPLAAQSHNYYMLTSEYPINYLHFLAPDDTHILIAGGPVEYYIFTPPGHPSRDSSLNPYVAAAASKTILGRDYLAGQVPIISIPGGCWKALRLCEGVEYALMANVLAPEWTKDGLKIGAGQGFVEMFNGRAEWSTEKFLKGLIGKENWVTDGN
jgi:uncharacterized protein